VSTEQGKVSIKLLKIQEHPVQKGYPAVLVEEKFENGEGRTVLIGMDILTQNWTEPILRKLKSGIRFTSSN
jgi:hypothetical protein